MFGYAFFSLSSVYILSHISPMNVKGFIPSLLRDCLIIAVNDIVASKTTIITSIFVKVLPILCGILSIDLLR